MEGEVTVICMDISSWMGDHKSDRFLAQVDAVELYCKHKIDCNPENYVGILAMGKNVNNVVDEPTRDLQMIMNRIQCLRVESDSMNILDALKMADEYVKTSKLQKRIAVFAGGPVFYFKHWLIKIGMEFKDRGVAVDVVNFGDHQGPRPGRSRDFGFYHGPRRGRPRDFGDNQGPGLGRSRGTESLMTENDKQIPGESKREILEALVDAANNDDNSNILHVPEDESSLRDHLSRSPILSRERWEQCNSLQSVNKRQKTKIDTLTQENENLKRELELFRTELSKFVNKVRGPQKISCII